MEENMLLNHHHHLTLHHLPQIRSASSPHSACCTISASPSPDIVRRLTTSPSPVIAHRRTASLSPVTDPRCAACPLFLHQSPSPPPPWISSPLLPVISLFFGLKSTNHPMQTPTSVSTQSTTTISERRRDGPIFHPERPGKPVCGIYQYDGTCDFGAACPFDHPTDLIPTGPKKRKRGEKKPRLTLRGFTFEEQEAHFKRANETDGFHVGYVPLGSRRGGIIYPVPVSQCSSIPKNLAKLAIKGYNEEHATTYKFVKLIRVNMKSVGGILY